MKDFQSDSLEPYVILRADSAVQLADFVNAGIEKGFWPIGGITIDRWNPNEGDANYYQAVTKKHKRIALVNRVTDLQLARDSDALIKNNGALLAQCNELTAALNKALNNLVEFCTKNL
jgi:hypothetical protein